MTDLKKLAEDQVKYFRNVANHGRGSEMTKALHDACDEIERLQRNTLRPKPDHCLLDIPMGTPCAMAGYCDYTTLLQEVERLREQLKRARQETLEGVKKSLAGLRPLCGGHLVDDMVYQEGWKHCRNAMQGALGIIIHEALQHTGEDGGTKP